MNTPAAGRLIILGSQLAKSAGLERRVAALGYDVVAVLDDLDAAGEHANGTDLALVDLHLGGEAGGNAASRRLRNEHDLPALLVTRRDDDGSAATSARASDLGCVQVPSHGRELQAILQKALIRQRVEIERRNFERRRIAAQKCESLGKVGGRLVHDFNNILQAMLGHVQLAARALPEQSPLQGFLTHAVEAGMRGAGLCHEYNLFTQGPSITPHLADLNGLVRESQILLRTVVKKGTRLDYALAPSLPALAIDPAYLRQIIIGLALHAAEVVGVHRGLLRISTEHRWLRAETLAALPGAAARDEGDYVSLGFDYEWELSSRCSAHPIIREDSGGQDDLSAIRSIVQLHGGAMETGDQAAARQGFIRVHLPVPRR